MKYLYVVAVLGLMACGGDDKAITKSPSFSGLQSEILVAKEQALSESIQTTGTVLPNEQVQLKAEEGGRLIKIHFKEGAFTKTGDALFQIDDREFQAQAKNIRVQLDLAKRELKRNTALFEAQALSEEILDASANRVATLQAELDILGVRIDRCLIRAPFSGRLGLRQVSEGAYISVGQWLVTLVQDRPLKMEFEVPELYASQIKIGMGILATHSGYKDTLRGVIYAFEPQIDAGSRNLKIRALCSESSMNLVPGAFLNIGLKLSESANAILIPTQALIPELNGQKVFLVKNGVVKGQKVSTGIRRAKDIQISEGVQVGDSILLTGILQAREGMPVKSTERSSQQ